MSIATSCKNRTLIITSMILLFCACGTVQEFPLAEYKLWYENPASHFEEALVLGNGKMGATLFGGTHTDSIYLNDATLWSGEPVDPNMNPDAHLYIPQIREALNNEDYRLADSLNRFVQGSFSQSFAPLGTLYLDFSHPVEPTDYYRELNISNATSTITYNIGEVGYSREYSVSFPDQVMIIKLKSDHQKALNFSLDFSSLLKFQKSGSDQTLEIEGYAPYHTEPSYRGDMEDAVLFDQERGTRFSTLVNVKETDGHVSMDNSRLTISGASEAILLVSVATSFNGFDKNPATQGADYKQLAGNQLEKAKKQSYDNLITHHQWDYKSYFDRLTFNLAKEEIPNLPTDKRLMRYAGGEEDKYLEELYFQLGRYLLISSSRTDQVPANLQGIWNPYMRPPWSSNYTTNINVEENYWLAETANLSEMHQPLLGFIENIAQTGAVSAKTFYGVEKGWSVGHNSDIWAMSNPVGDFGKGNPVWAGWNMAGAWLSTHLWEHYIFTLDKDFLQNRAYPLMKGSAVFCLNWLVEHKNGRLITSPSTSPENLFLLEDGYRGATFYGATSDLAMIRELLSQTIRAAEILQIDEAFVSEMETTLSRLHPYQIGKHGQLLEWYHDWDDADPQHRHQTHLFGLHPGHHITPGETPDLALACRKTLEIKGEKSTGWSQGWRINLWARLKDGQRAYRMYRQLLTYVDPSGLNANYSNAGGTYPNLLDAHPPFQIDGNFGGAAGVIEMLIQSSEDAIELLPALPEQWPEGQLSGVMTRGGFEVSIRWKNHEVKSCSIYSKTGGITTLKHLEETKDIELDPGQRLELKW